ncbi:MAG: Crp/Fnr family transcriptional regulator [Cyclobacteriaceae bacterium]
MTEEKIREVFPQLNPKLISELAAVSKISELEEGTEILREGQYIKVIPIVLKGLIKVFTRQEGKELLLYYIRPNESCIMSFSSGINNRPSRIYAVSEENTTALLIPTDKVPELSRQFPDINTLFFNQYNLRYTELLNTIQHLLFDRMDKRLHDYLLEKASLTNKNPLKISHREIANELGTAREVISRIMKKLEAEGKVRQHPGTIEII